MTRQEKYIQDKIRESRERSLTAYFQKLNLREIYDVMASRSKVDVDRIGDYMEDVRSLAGKLPDGSFGREITPNEEEILRGFQGNHFELYKDILRGYLGWLIGQERYMRDLPSDDTFPGRLEGDRRHAILLTLKKLVPDFEYQDEGLTDGKTAGIPFPIGGKPGWKRRFKRR